MPVKLTFDTDYLDYTIQAWRDHNLAPLAVEDLKHDVVTYAARKLADRNAIGFLEKDVDEGQISKVFTLFKQLKLTTESKVGAKDAKITKISPTATGKRILSMDPLYQRIRPQLTTHIAEASPEVADILKALVHYGPVVKLVNRPLPGYVYKGAKLKDKAKEGIFTLLQRYAPDSVLPPFTAKTNVTQMLAAANGLIAPPHGPIAPKDLDKFIPVARDLGLVWENWQRGNEIIAVEIIGSAATMTKEGIFPNVPAWEALREAFIDFLVDYAESHEDGAGFITVEELRGALSEHFQIAQPITDAFLCQLRDETDAANGALRLHFEGDEESYYLADRNPLIWHEQSYDRIAVVPHADLSPAYQTIS